MPARPWRMRPPHALALMLGLWALASSAGAQVYRWVDPDGSIHYSDNSAAAPKDAKVEVTTGDDITVEGTGRIEAGSPPGNPPVPNPQPAPGSGASGEWSASSDDASEQTVRETFRNAHQKIADAERQLAAQREVVRSFENGTAQFCRSSNPDECAQWSRRNRSSLDEARQKLTQLEAELRKWKSYLDDLERWASSKSVPRAWRE